MKITKAELRKMILEAIKNIQEADKFRSEEWQLPRSVHLGATDHADTDPRAKFKLELVWDGWQKTVFLTRKEYNEMRYTAGNVQTG